MRCCGVAGAAPRPSLSVAEFAALLEGAARRWRFDLSGLDPAGRFSPAAARLALNVALLAAEALPGGGTAALAGDPAGDVLVTLAGPSGCGLRFWLPLVTSAMRRWPGVALLRAQDASRGLQGWLTALIARGSGLRVAFLMAATTEAAPPLLLSLAG